VLNTTVVICSANRPDVLAETVESLLNRQLLPPREVIISVFNEEHVHEETRTNPAVRIVVGNKQGTCVQRNVAARQVQTQYTLFLDDDVELAPDFIGSMERLMGDAEDAVAATGFLVIDGARTDSGLDREAARAYAMNYVRNLDNYDHREGQNVFVRTRLFKNVLFDENLPLYGWLEDLDFATNIRRYGRIVMNTETCWAHIGCPGGRTNGVRFGYSQVANPFYLWRKNGTPGLANVIFRHWLRYLVFNGKNALFKAPTKRNDRSGRFTGNLIALGHLMAGKLNPSYVVNLSQQSTIKYPARGRPRISDAEGAIRN
jgi:GT2 family glycosyltransferase